eukprot:TRINITY_DN70162_c0_g1_i1.p1 TRINITY_DN70162_c0_g1~~TRINITY_DN70162_c0_g1_i1.p1  ORF type:complete len:418 (+),score=42.94 TRINITY_DN70162_c0_g1_i1:124-1377(+)
MVVWPQLLSAAVVWTVAWVDVAVLSLTVAEATVTQGQLAKRLDAYAGGRYRKSSTRSRVLQRSRSSQVPITQPPVSPLGVADVAPPTRSPPGPQSLEPWNDIQPMDTLVGDLFVGISREDPTESPPLNQRGIALGCPVLLDWPKQVQVILPDCKTPGKWTTAGSPPSLLMEWSARCSLFVQDLAPPVYYTTSNGDHFGTSQTNTQFFGVLVKLRNCKGDLMYTIEEEVYRQNGKPDEASCRLYGSCDGVIFLQYSIKDASGRLVARTPYLHLFQDDWVITAPGGAIIATVTRSPGWSPVSDKACGDEKRWYVTFSDDIPGVFSTAAQQWPIVELVTIMSVRDGYRLSNGMMRPGACEICRAIMQYIILCIAIIVSAVVGFVFYHVLLNRFRHKLFEFEQRVCPKRMALPSKHDAQFV